MASGRKPNNAFLPGNIQPGQVPINTGGAYASLNNNLERFFYNHYYYILYTYALNMFKWENLPDGIPSKFIERILLDTGFGAFGTYMGKKVFLKCSLTGPLDMYYEPKKVRLFSVDNVHFEADASECVIVYNNYNRLPTAPFLSTYAARMAKAEAFIHVNMNANKTPLVLTVDKKTELSLRNMYAQFEGNQPVMVQVDSMQYDEPLKSVDTGADWLVDKAQAYKRETWDEAMLFLGIRTTPVEKKERLVTAEVSGDLQQIELARKIQLNARQDAVPMINKLWGTNISVEFGLMDDSNALLGNIGGDTVDSNAANVTNRDTQPG